MSITRYQNFVNGAFTEHTGDFFQILNPSTKEVLAEAPNTSKEDTDAAVAAARAAQPAWEHTSDVERAGYLHKIAALLRADEQKFTDIIVAEQGKTQQLANVEVNFTADYMDYMAEWARRLEGEVIPDERAGETMILGYRPLGVVAGILPWNFPFFLIARKAAPALLTGNTIVIKPSSDTPINAFEFAKLVERSGLPAGVFNLVSGRGSVTGEALVQNPDVDLITFTGSIPQGKHIMTEAGKNLTRVNLELGGKAPAIVLADADLDVAVDSIWQSRIGNSGQICNCAERVYVERPIHDAFVAKLKAKFEATKFGNPADDDTLDYGPLINEGALKSVSAVVDKAVEQGATVVCGSQDGVSDEGYFFAPVLLDDATTEMSVMQEETFGPVLPIQIVDSLDEAIALANDSVYGLTSSVFTENINSATKAARELQYGETYINRENFESMQGFHAGRKHSGIGGADGKHGLLEFVETHVTYLQTH
ncbi:aldehyde dehydrogenase [Acidipropionibacterium acidipropionici]|jgi:lactaldehyde dehydrogenase/glycolaldehyde dehydrogenase|uniref:Aldehyde dehydrogenase n=1 Tax=Acidipropionibacterium acidipropionici TaxID=1748 RepID=A0AAC9AP00_9ACTN|nr:aldehyde dehydrogenase [Acidipropionibacterium acidipropionici]AMS06234.1 aldehyde dehydrogenase [Acidipropionibacterium acidipropionici]AOZ47690.1 aldehyde dehydrogenase [Acidipropionibacterium acidipropionici]AZP38975.1 aldehyde dehydrogenase [Acidipropionibacterium acidipropionici]MDN6556833.1 aldehyde dehydrogenase [Acidipropionibacterium acidipropionici]